MNVRLFGTRILVTALVALLFQMPLPTQGEAATAGRAMFDDRSTAAGTNLALRCTAVLKYMMLVDVYAAGLYLGDGVSAQQVLDDVPKRLEIEYFYRISAKDFVRATQERIAANVDAETFASLRPSIEKMNSLYEDVAPGDRYALTYVPGVGTELALNGVPKGTIPGANFAAAIFSIWLGSEPIDAELKRDLLTCS